MTTAVRRNGFSLLEVLVATTVLLVAVASLARLVASSLRVHADARAMTDATVLADDKVQELRAVPWGDARLAPSPAGSLAVTTPGYADYVDSWGREVGTGTEVPAGAVYVRRWSIAPCPGAANAALAIEVAVALQVAGSGGDRPARDEVRVTAVRLRIAP